MSYDLQILITTINIEFRDRSRLVLKVLWFEDHNFIFFLTFQTIISIFGYTVPKRLGYIEKVSYLFGWALRRLQSWKTFTVFEIFRSLPNTGNLFRMTLISKIYAHFQILVENYSISGTLNTARYFKFYLPEVNLKKSNRIASKIKSYFYT